MKTKKDIEYWFYKITYTLFICIALYQILLKNDLIDAAINLGIGLIFDPFNRRVEWSKRPLWQKIWLCTHLSIVILLLLIGIFSDKIF